MVNGMVKVAVEELVVKLSILELVKVAVAEALLAAQKGDARRKLVSARDRLGVSSAMKAARAGHKALSQSLASFEY